MPLTIKDRVRPYRKLRISSKCSSITYYNDKLGIEQTIKATREDDIALVKALVKRNTITIEEVYND